MHLKLHGEKAKGNFNFKNCAKIDQTTTLFQNEWARDQFRAAGFQEVVLDSIQQYRGIHDDDDAPPPVTKFVLFSLSQFAAVLTFQTRVFSWQVLDLFATFQFLLPLFES